jgi:hypothetical protein
MVKWKERKKEKKETTQGVMGGIKENRGDVAYYTAGCLFW